MTEVVVVIPPSVPPVVVVPPTPSPTDSSSVNVSGTTVGPQGPKGPKGDTGPTGGNYAHTQGVPASTWTIHHNLGFRPAVSVIDSAGSQVEGQTVWNDLNTVTITFSGAFSGVAYLS